MEVFLPDVSERLQFLQTQTAGLRENNKIDPNVSLENVAKRTRNFSRAELGVLLRAATSWAIWRLVKFDGKIQADPDEIVKFVIKSEDFDYALKNDVKPKFGRPEDSFQRLQPGGMISWGPEVTQILNEGNFLAETVKNPESSGFHSVVVKGAAKTGKTSLAAQICNNTEFPFVKIITPDILVGCSESEKCIALKKAFDDSKLSKLSVLLIDDLDRLVEYTPNGTHCLRTVLHSLSEVTKAPPPVGHRRLVIATSSDSFFCSMNLTNVFDSVIKVPLLSTSDQMMNVIRDSKIYSDDQLETIEQKLRLFEEKRNFGIGIKHLLRFIDSARRCKPENRVSILLSKIEAVALSIF